jgi:hypothetical protein
MKPLERRIERLEKSSPAVNRAALLHAARMRTIAGQPRLKPGDAVSAKITAARARVSHMKGANQ